MVLLAVVAVGVALAAGFGPRSLNAVVLPSAVALVAAVAQVYRVDPPRVSRETPAPGFPGDSGTVTLRLDAARTYPATVTDALPSGLDGSVERSPAARRARSGDGATLDAVVGGDPVSYEVRYRARGEHELGPLSVVATDLLGLARREVVAAGTDSVLVYPPVRRLSKSATRELAALFDPEPAARRDEFDHLREYARGDSLRDVHWKSSAKRGDLIVKEYLAETDAESVHLSAGGARAAADRMAEAAATLAVALVRAGVPVTLSTPSGVVEAGPGDEKRPLEHLARAAGGPVPDESADVVVRASASETFVRLGDREATFERLVDDASPTGDDDAPPDGNGDGDAANAEVAA
jgi:uncharacterized protein (DUF58 family)